MRREGGVPQAHASTCAPSDVGRCPGGDKADDASGFFGTAVRARKAVEVRPQKCACGLVALTRRSPALGKIAASFPSRRSGVSDHHGVRPEHGNLLPFACTKPDINIWQGSDVVSGPPELVRERITAMPVRVGGGYVDHQWLLGSVSASTYTSADSPGMCSARLSGRGGESFGVEPVLGGVAGGDGVDPGVPGVEVGVGVERSRSVRRSSRGLRRDPSGRGGGVRLR